MSVEKRRLDVVFFCSDDGVFFLTTGSHHLECEERKVMAKLRSEKCDIEFYKKHTYGRKKQKNSKKDGLAQSYH